MSEVRYQKSEVRFQIKKVTAIICQSLVFHNQDSNPDRQNQNL